MSSLPAAFAENSKQPNVLLIVSDDQGYADRGYVGSPIETPNLDGLAEDGLSLENFHTMPQCVPSRYSLHTGLWPHFVGWPTRHVGGKYGTGLPTETITIAELLQMRGYRTAMFGKWHMGSDPTKTDQFPLAHGFEEFEGIFHGSADYFRLSGRDGFDWWKNANLDKDARGYATKRIADAAIEFIEQTDNPWYLNINFTAPHSPWQKPPVSPFGNDWYLHYERKGLNSPEQPDRAKYAAMISYMDEMIGLIVETLKKTKQYEDTVLIFLSDNGGNPEVADNSPWRGGKGDLLEGGVHTFAVMVWPRVFPAAQTLNHLTAIVDIAPTIMQALGVETAPLGFSGRSVQDTLKFGDEGRGFIFMTTEAGGDIKMVHATPAHKVIWIEGKKTARYDRQVNPPGYNEHENLWAFWEDE